MPMDLKNLDKNPPNRKSKTFAQRLFVNGKKNHGFWERNP
jgi:hypothetical protein